MFNRASNLWSAFWKSRAERLTRLEREFQPASIELIETPASPTVRMASLLLMTFICLTLSWAYFGKIDVHANLQGKLVTRIPIQIINSPLSGQVLSVRVKNGDQVVEGELLFVVDPSSSALDREGATAQLSIVQTSFARQSALILLVSGDLLLDDGVPCDVFISEVDVGECVASSISDFSKNEALEKDVQAMFEAYLAERELLKNQLLEKEAEAESVRTTLRELDVGLELIDEQMTIQTDLFTRAISTRKDYLSIARDRQAFVIRIEGEKSRLGEVAAGIATLQSRLEEHRKAYISRLLEERIATQQMVQDLRRKVEKADFMMEQSYVRAPFTGTIRSLEVSTLGQTISMGQKLMEIVPSDQILEMEGMILNRDIGTVQIGQSARIKVEAYPFTRFGTLEAEIFQIGTDAIMLGQGGSDSTVDMAGRVGNLVYPAKIRLAAQQLSDQGQPLALIPGMSVVAEVRTHERRVISYFLDPVLKALDESLRER